MGKKLLRFILFFLACLAVCLTIYALFFGRTDGISGLLQQNKIAAALTLLLLYAVKSLSVAMPCKALQICAGLLFPLPAAIAVNLLGMAISLSLPFRIGHTWGSPLLQRLYEKYPKLESLSALYEGKTFLFSLVVRLAGGLPMDVVSMTLGAMGLQYGAYIVGAVFGILPGMVTTTVLASTVSSPDSPAFLTALAVKLAAAGVTLALYTGKVTKDLKTRKA